MLVHFFPVSSSPTGEFQSCMMVVTVLFPKTRQWENSRPTISTLWAFPLSFGNINITSDITLTPTLPTIQSKLLLIKQNSSSYSLISFFFFFLNIVPLPLTRSSAFLHIVHGNHGINCNLHSPNTPRSKLKYRLFFFLFFLPSQQYYAWVLFAFVAARWFIRDIEVVLSGKYDDITLMKMNTQEKCKNHILVI